MSTHFVPLLLLAAIPLPNDVKTAPRAFAAEPEDHAVAAAPAAGAQAATRALEAPRAPVIDRNRLWFDVDAQGTVWVRGRTYKAAFSGESATYVPFLGSDAPRNFPVSLRVDALTIGGEPVAFDASAPAVRTGDVVEYRRGAFRERYVLTPDSVEQTFVFDDLLRRGEVVVTLDVTSELLGCADADGFRFENELGHVRYGRAFAFHDGASATPIESRLEDGTIRLVAPAALVDGASGRFTIDPVLSTYAVEDSPQDEFAADSAYDATNGVWLTVCEEVYSADDHDVHCVRHTTAGTVTASDYADFTGVHWRSPAVANNNLDDQFLVVAARGESPDREIWGRTVEATVTLNMSAQFVINDTALQGEAYAPDVGGDFVTSAPAWYCVVWERQYDATDIDVHARLVRTDATLVGGGTLFVDNSSATLHTNPAISNSNGSGPAALQDWNVVWEDEITPTNHNILGARIHWDGTLSEATFPVATGVLDERNPSATAIVDETGGTRAWMVAYQMDSGATNGWDVRCRTFDGASIIATFELSEQFPSVALDQITPSCDTDGEQFVVAHDERASPFFTATDVKVSTLYSLGGALGVNEGQVSVSPGIFTDLRPRIVAAASSGSSSDDALVVFDREDAGPNDVYATGYDLQNGGPVTGFCAGDGSGTACPCGNSGAPGNGCASSVNAAGANLAHNGNADLSSDSLTLIASGLPASAPVLFFQGTSQSGAGAGTSFGDGLRCASGTVIRLATKTASSGSASYPQIGELDVSVRGAVPAAGAVRHYQGWYRNSASFCTSSTFNLTNGLRVQWIP